MEFSFIYDSYRISSSHVHIAHVEIGEGTDSDKESAPNLTCAAPRARTDFGIRFPHGVTAFSITSPTPTASNAPRLRIVMYECSHKNIIRRREAGRGRLDRVGNPKGVSRSLSIDRRTRGQSLARSEFFTLQITTMQTGAHSKRTYL